MQSLFSHTDGTGDTVQLLRLEKGKYALGIIANGSVSLVGLDSGQLSQLRNAIDDSRALDRTDPEG